MAMMTRACAATTGVGFRSLGFGGFPTTVLISYAWDYDMLDGI